MPDMLDPALATSCSENKHPSNFEGSLFFFDSKIRTLKRTQIWGISGKRARLRWLLGVSLCLPLPFAPYRYKACCPAESGLPNWSGGWMCDRSHYIHPSWAPTGAVCPNCTRAAIGGKGGGIGGEGGDGGVGGR